MIDRSQNRHVTFGVGLLRYLGSNLAQLELQLSIEMFLRKIAECRLDADGTFQ